MFQNKIKFVILYLTIKYKLISICLLLNVKYIRKSIIYIEYNSKKIIEFLKFLMNKFI